MKRYLCLGLLLALIACSQRPLRTQLSSTSDSGNAEPDDDKDLGNTKDEDTDDETSTGDGTGDVDPGEDTGNKDETETPDPEIPKADPKTFAASLDNFRWQFQCDRDVGGDQECDSPDLTDSTKTFGGESSKSYTVELRFRGVVEPMMYKDGKLEGERFYTGGTTNNGTYNIYSIEVSDPKEVYFLNYNDSVGHDVFIVDYTAKIKIKGGAKVRLYGNGQNLRMIANYKKLVVPELDQDGKPFNGQYIQMNVVGVTED